MSSFYIFCLVVLNVYLIRRILRADRKVKNSIIDLEIKNVELKKERYRLDFIRRNALNFSAFLEASLDDVPPEIENVLKTSVAYNRDYIQRVAHTYDNIINMSDKNTPPFDSLEDAFQFSKEAGRP